MRLVRTLAWTAALLVVALLARPLTADEPVPAPAPAPAPPSSTPAADPKPSDPKPSDPKPGEPKPAEPKPGEPKPGEPKPGDGPPGDAPANPPPAPAPGGRPGETPEQREARELEEDEKERRRREAAKGGDDANRPPPPTAPRPGPPGMCYVPGGEALIGTTNERLAQLIGNRPPEVKRVFDYERPQHKRTMTEYWILRTEVTNAQYARFLQEQATAYVCDGKFPTLVDVAGHLLHTPKPEEDELSWLQLANANRDALTKALPDVPFPDGFKTALLPKDKTLVLTFVKRKPPMDWAGVAPPPEELNHPVRGVSCLDIEACCEWMGLKLQSEFEYEWAGRGPEGFDFPWGNVWYDDVSHCNWGAKVVDAKTFNARTWPVGSQPKGRSWVGAMDLLGNVAEWTSSPFEAYPKGNPQHDFMHVVRIIRGATAVDLEPSVLRLAYRNFVGAGRNIAPPYPENPFLWVGFRTVWYAQPGRNQEPTLYARATRGGRVKREELVSANLSGTVAEDWDPEGKDGVWVRGEAKAVVFVPKACLLDVDDPKFKEQRAEDAINVVRARTRAGLLSESATEHPRLVLGALQCDVRLTKVFKRVKVVIPTDPEERKKWEDEQKKKKRGRPEAPLTEEGVQEPGTFLLVLWHGRLALCDTSLEFKCFLTPTGKQPTLDVRKLKEDEKPGCKVSVDDTVHLVNGQFLFPLALGKNQDPNLCVAGSFSVDGHPEDLERPNGWR